jgi:hypothetical protein
VNDERWSVAILRLRRSTATWGVYAAIFQQRSRLVGEPVGPFPATTRVTAIVQAILVLPAIESLLAPFDVEQEQIPGVEAIERARPINGSSVRVRPSAPEPVLRRTRQRHWRYGPVQALALASSAPERGHNVALDPGRVHASSG